MKGLTALAVAGAVVVGIVVGMVLHGRFASRPALALPALHGQATWSPGKRPAPDFTLLDQRGRRVALSSLRGRAIALLFMDSICKEACPIEGHLIAAAIRQVPAAQKPRLVIVSVDPAGDTPRTIAAAGRKWTLPHGFLWLRGTKRELARVWRAYQITVEPSSGDVIHSTAAYLIDPRGNERAGFLMPFVPGLVADDLKTLAA